MTLLFLLSHGDQIEDAGQGGDMFMVDMHQEDVETFKAMLEEDTYT